MKVWPEPTGSTIKIVSAIAHRLVAAHISLIAKARPARPPCAPKVREHLMKDLLAPWFQAGISSRLTGPDRLQRL